MPPNGRFCADLQSAVDVLLKVRRSAPWPPQILQAFASATDAPNPEAGQVSPRSRRSVARLLVAAAGNGCRGALHDFCNIAGKAVELRKLVDEDNLPKSKFRRFVSASAADNAIKEAWAT